MKFPLILAGHLWPAPRRPLQITIQVIRPAAKTAQNLIPTTILPRINPICVEFKLCVLVVNMVR